MLLSPALPSLDTSVAVLKLEKLPPGSPCDFQLLARSAPLDFVISTEWIKEAAAFFAYPGASDLKDKLSGQLYK